MGRKILNWIGYIILALFVITLLYVFTVRITGKTPQLFGYSVHRVISGSMEPHIEIGDVILVKKTDSPELKKGDVITYKGTQGDVAGKTVTHQIVSEPYEQNGRYYFTTQGTALGAPLDPEIDDTQVIGKVLCIIPLLGSLFDFFTHWYGYLAIILLLLVAFGSELINIISLLRRNKVEKAVEKLPPVKKSDLDEQFHEKRAQEIDEILIDLDKGN